jgi:hypothetical protein
VTDLVPRVGDPLRENIEVGVGDGRSCRHDGPFHPADEQMAELLTIVAQTRLLRNHDSGLECVADESFSC